MVSNPSAQPAPKAMSPELLRNRNRTVAKSFYRQLRTEGFSHAQIIELSASLLDLVNDELCERGATAE